MEQLNGIELPIQGSAGTFASPSVQIITPTAVKCSESEFCKSSQTLGKFSSNHGVVASTGRVAVKLATTADAILQNGEARGRGEQRGEREKRSYSQHDTAKLLSGCGYRELRYGPVELN